MHPQVGQGAAGWRVGSGSGRFPLAQVVANVGSGGSGEVGSIQWIHVT